MVYVSEALAAANTSPKTVNVTSVGYYYYDAPNNVWVKMNASTNAGSIEPWYNSATSQPADSNTQNIYQMGNVGIGVKPPATPDFKFYVRNESPANGATGLASGINNIAISKGEDRAVGITNYVYDKSTSGSSKATYGNYTIVNDESTVVRQGSGGYFRYNITGVRNNTSVPGTTSGLQATSTVNPTNGNFAGARIYGILADSQGTAQSGDVNVHNVRGATGNATATAEAGRTMKVSEDLSGSAFWSNLIAKAGGSIEVNSAIGAAGYLYTDRGEAGGNVKITDAYGLRSYSVLGGAQTVDIDNLYGLKVSVGTASSGSNATINKMYGIYVNDFRSPSANVGDAYNFYSQGVNSKNYFEGKVGIGTTTPSTKLEINNGTTNGAIKIVDGTQGAGKVLTSDANGLATWQAPKALAVKGEIGGYNVPFETHSGYRYTGATIALPPGKWLVTITQYVYITGFDSGGTNILLSPDDWMITRTTFSDQTNVTTIGQDASPSSDISQPSTMTFTVHGPHRGDAKTGVIYINNTSSAPKTYKYIAGGTEATGPLVGHGGYLNNFAGNWAENSITAVAIN
ncbi:hypothetical protein D3C71_07760 [compost metagenome]